MWNLSINWTYCTLYEWSIKSECTSSIQFKKFVFKTKIFYLQTSHIYYIVLIDTFKLNWTLLAKKLVQVRVVTTLLLINKSNPNKIKIKKSVAIKKVNIELK